MFDLSEVCEAADLYLFSKHLPNPEMWNRTATCDHLVVTSFYKDNNGLITQETTKDNKSVRIYR